MRLLLLSLALLAPGCRQPASPAGGSVPAAPPPAEEAPPPAEAPPPPEAPPVATPDPRGEPIDTIYSRLGVDTLIIRRD